MKRKLFISLIISLLICIPVTAGTLIYKLVPASYPIMVNGTSLSSDRPVMNYQGITYVPLRAVLDITGARTEFANNKVNVVTTKTGTVEDVARQAENCVMITVYKDDKVTGQGSGVLIGNGLVVTNKHVLDMGNLFVVQYNDTTYLDTTKRYPIKGDIDIGFIQDPQNRTSTIKLGDSDRLIKGEKIVSIGSPEACLNTVTEGIFSRLTTEEGIVYEQHNAPTSRGSSGSGLFDMKSNLVGIEMSYHPDHNISFAISINEVKKVLEQIKK